MEVYMDLMVNQGKGERRSDSFVLSALIISPDLLRSHQNLHDCASSITLIKDGLKMQYEYQLFFKRSL